MTPDVYPAQVRPTVVYANNCLMIKAAYLRGPWAFSSDRFVYKLFIVSDISITVIIS